MWEQILAIFIVLGLLVISLWLLRRKGIASVKLGFGKRLSGTPRIELVERIPLTTHHSLHLVRIEDQLVLIGVSPQSCTAVHSYPAPASTAASWQGS